MNTKHTPGPWKDNGRYGGDQRIVGSDGTPVIWLDDDGACGDPECCGSPTFYLEIGANDLPLILSAPELLALVQRFKRETFAAPPQLLAEIDAAIAKATGYQS